MPSNDESNSRQLVGNGNASYGFDILPKDIEDEESSEYEGSTTCLNGVVYSDADVLSDIGNTTNDFNADTSCKMLCDTCESKVLTNSDRSNDDDDDAGNKDNDDNGDDDCTATILMSTPHSSSTLSTQLQQQQQQKKPQFLLTCVELARPTDITARRHTRRYTPYILGSQNNNRQQHQQQQKQCRQTAAAIVTTRQNSDDQAQQCCYAVMPQQRRRLVNGYESLSRLCGTFKAPVMLAAKITGLVILAREFVDTDTIVSLYEQLSRIF